LLALMERNRNEPHKDAVRDVRLEGVSFFEQADSVRVSY